MQPLASTSHRREGNIPLLLLASFNSSQDHTAGLVHPAPFCPHQVTRRSPAGGVCKAGGRVYKRRQGAASHKPLSLHRREVTVLMKGSGTSITAEEHSSIQADLTNVWVFQLEGKTMTTSTWAPDDQRCGNLGLIAFVWTCRDSCVSPELWRESMEWGFQKKNSWNAVKFRKLSCVEFCLKNQRF